MQDRLDIAPVCLEHHTLSSLAFVGEAGTHIVDAEREGVRVFLAWLVVRVLWHVANPPGACLRRRLALRPSLVSGLQAYDPIRHLLRRRPLRRRERLLRGSRRV